MRNKGLRPTFGERLGYRTERHRGVSRRPTWRRGVGWLGLLLVIGGALALGMMGPFDGPFVNPWKSAMPRPAPEGARAPSPSRDLRLVLRLVGSNDFKVSIWALADFARGLQTPGEAVGHFGDPVSVVGADAPILSFNLGGMLGLPHDRWLILFYGPSAGGSKRLSKFEILYAPAATEKQVVEWLGPPVESERDERGRPKLVYGRRDRAGLRVRDVSWDQPSEQEPSRLRLRFDGRAGA